MTNWNHYLHYNNACGHQILQGGHLPWGASIHKVIITWPCKITWQAKTITSSLQQCLWPPNFSGWWLNLQELLPIKSWSCGLARSFDRLKPLYLHRNYAMTIKLGRVVTSWGSPTHKVTWSFNHVVLQDHLSNQNILFPPLQSLWPPNLAVWWHTMRITYRQSHVILQLHGLMRSHNKLNTLHFQLH